MKQEVELKKWNRCEVFEFFSNYDDPYTGFTTPIKVTKVKKYIEKRNITFYELVSYIILQSINEIEEFKYCLENNRVYRYNQINLSCTVLTNDNVMQFTNVINYNDDIGIFLKEFRNEKTAAELKSKTKENISMNKIYISCVPWARITSIKHPADFKKIDSVPRITWGKIYQGHHDSYIDLSIQVNHSFQDGYHLGLLIKKIEEKINGLL